MKGVTSSYTRAFGESCRREFEKVSFASSGIIPSQSCIRAKYSVVWRFATSILYVYPSTPSHWLSCSKIKESVQGELFGLPRVETSMSLMMVPNQNSVVFYCKTTMWACLSGTTCSHVCSRTSSCFGACYRSSSPENPATSSRRFVLQTFIFLPRLDESGISWHQPDLNLRQIWWFGTFPKNYNIGPSKTGKVDVVANTPSRKTCYYNILIEEVGHLPIGIS